MTRAPPAAMAVMRGALGSSENSAVQGRSASSFQWTVAEVAVEVTVTGPGRTPEASSVTAAANRQSNKTGRIRSMLFMTTSKAYSPLNQQVSHRARRVAGDLAEVSRRGIEVRDIHL